MAVAPLQSDMPAPPLPPRYRALRRCMVISLALVAWHVGLWFLWNFEADRRLRAFVAERRALREPVLAEDFARPVVVDEENAAHWLAKASDALYSDPLTGVGWRDEREFPVCEAGGRPELDAVRDIFALARRAADCPVADFGGSFTSPVVNNFYPTTGFSISVLRLIAHGACAAAQSRDLQRSIDLIDLDLRIARQYLTPPRSIVSVATYAALRERISNVVACISAGPRGSLTHERESLRAIAAELCNDRGFGSHLRDALLVERLVVLDAGWNYSRPEVLAALRDPMLAHLYGHNPLTDVPVVFDPAFRLAAWHTCKRITVLADLAGANDGKLVHELAQPRSWNLFPCCLQHPLLDVGREDAGLRYLMQLTLARIASTRASGIILAARLFEEDHGCVPNALQDLVPMYLDELPRDPFSRTSGTFCYLWWTDPPRVFSVGPGGDYDGMPERRLNEESAQSEVYRTHCAIGLLAPRD
ncbi:MAG: hypothetical protein SF069_05930 [Phycisphaerae bacterium]|nr:hypothetical protein [Phycisphaerae bacterium]